MKSGIDQSCIDPSVRPQDDLFRHVNGRWLQTTQIPPDRSRHGEFMVLHDGAEKNVRAIIDELAAKDQLDPTSDEFKIASLYRDFMDAEAIEAAGVTPIAGTLAQIESVSNATDLLRLMGQFQGEGIGGALVAFVDTDSKDSSRYILNLSQSGIGLPDESYYREEQFEPIRVAYFAHVQRMFELVGYSEPLRGADSVRQLETRLAIAHWDRTEVRDVSKTYNPMSRSELNLLMPSFDWNSWLEGAGAASEILTEVVVRQPTFAEALSVAITEVDLQIWRDWLAWQVIRASAGFLSEAIVDESFDFYGKTLTGAQELRERWKRGVSLVESVLGEAVGKAYVSRHFPPAAKEHTERLVAAIVAAYGANISSLPWMTADTKARALEKLAAFNPKIGYPGKWRDYSALTIVAGDLFGNIRRANAFETDRELAKLGSPVDRDEWFMLPQTVNAYYNPGMNEIVFPAAILQPPFFDPEAEDAVNFGGIGAVIGHEISHGFDDQGSKYDGAGNLENWWTEQDRQEFESRADALIKQFDNYETIEAPGHKVNGGLTVGENIGDLGGLTIAASAYQLSLAGENAPVIDGLTGMQRLIFGWAQVWRAKSRPEEAIRMLAIDPHSPHDLRCNATVRNLPEFYEAFEVADTDSLWLAPADRVSIW